MSDDNKCILPEMQQWRFKFQEFVYEFQEFLFHSSEHSKELPKNNWKILRRIKKNLSIPCLSHDVYVCRNRV